MPGLPILLVVAIQSCVRQVLSVFNTPMARHAKPSHALMLKHNSIRCFRRRLPVLPGNDNLAQLAGAIDSRWYRNSVAPECGRTTGLSPDATE
jgi:hypothetical protein